METDRLDPRAIARVSGPAWAPLKQAFLDINDILLSVCDDARAELTTIYVKYLPKPNATNVFAVAWLKSSKRIVVGLSLPESFESPELGAAPAGMKYQGLTKYFSVSANDVIPAELESWARTAFRLVSETK